MLKYRVITALILIPLVLFGIFYLPSLVFASVSAIVFLLAAWEWTALIGLSNAVKRFIYLAVFLLFFILLRWMPIPVVPFLTAATLTWIVMLYFVLHHYKFAEIWRYFPFWRAPLSIWLLGISWYGLNIIYNFHAKGSYYLLFLLLFVWGADTGAYFVGRRYGKHKLAPQISPGKSIEGVLGGVAVSLLVALIGGWFFYHALGKAYFSLLLLALITSLVSVLGDLAESMIKRQASVKDSGTLLPGHGGLLDRIDSLLSTAPVFALYLTITISNLFS